MIFAQIQIPGQSQPPQGPPAEDIRDIAPPEPLPDYLQLAVMITLAFLMGVMLVIVLWYFIRQHRLAKAAGPPPLSPLERATRALEALHADAGVLSPNELSVRASNIVKQYFHERYDDPVLFETTAEFDHRDNVEKTMPHSKRQALAEFFQRSELVKFAQLPEATGLAHAVLKDATTLVVEGADGKARHVLKNEPATAAHG